MGAAGVAKQSGIVSPAYGVYRIDPSIVVPAFVDTLVRTPGYVQEMTRFSRGVTSSRLRLYPDEFLALRTPVPPIEVQQRIIGKIERFRGSAENLVHRVTSQIELLIEHRQALITAAVTGEVAVPRAAA
jgi:type I restriction enzyme, S subunit